MIIITKLSKPTLAQIDKNRCKTPSARTWSVRGCARRDRTPCHTAAGNVAYLNQSIVPIRLVLRVDEAGAETTWSNPSGMGGIWTRR